MAINVKNESKKKTSFHAPPKSKKLERKLPEDVQMNPNLANAGAGNDAAFMPGNEGSVNSELSDGRAVIVQSFVNNALRTNGAQYVPIHLLTVPRYQRGEREKVLPIAKEWDDQKCEPVVLSFRDGNLYIVDGMQRCAAAKLVQKTEILCRILTGLTELQEMQIFKEQNKNRVVVSAYERICAEAALGLEVGVNILRIFDECGIKLIQGNMKAGACACAGEVRRVYRSIGEKGLRWILQTIEDLDWKDFVGGYRAIIIHNLAILYRNHENLDRVRDTLVRNYGKMDPDLVIAKAMSQFGRYKRNSLLALFNSVSSYIE